jgi:hypothetical protein
LANDAEDDSMDRDPYSGLESEPQAGPWEHLSEEALDDVRELALLQKGMLITVGVRLGLALALVFAPPNLFVLLATAYLFAALAGAGCSLLFGIPRQGALAAIGLGLATLLPLVGIVVSLILNAWAATELKQQHAPLGWFGVPWKLMPPS